MASTTSSSTQLEFTQAMTDFKVMFPDLDADVIEAVLRANNGAVDATIDHLLAMSADNEAERAINRTDNAGSKYTPPPAYQNNPPSYQQAVLQGDEAEGDLINLDNDDSKALDLLSDLDLLGAAGGVDPTEAGPLPEKQPLSPPDPSSEKASLSSSPKHAYSHPVRQAAEREIANESSEQQPCQQQSMIPTQQMLQDKYEENLRKREEVRKMGDPNMTQYLEDERVALMLQNEEFMAELRGDDEFMSALERESSRGSGDRFTDYSGGSSRSKVMMDEALFREKLKNMGKTSKRKFTQLANMFSRRKGAKELLGHAPAPSNDNLLLNAEPLIPQDSDDDYEDHEERHKKKTPTKGKYTSF